MNGYHLPDSLKSLRARADILPVAQASSHVMSHVVGDWVAGIGTAVHTINSLPHARASCSCFPCPFCVSLASPCSFAPCDEYNHVTVHRMTLYMYSLLNPIRAFPSEGRTSWVRRYRNLARVLMRIVLHAPTSSYMCA
jgi:hypothetical protein